MSANVYKTAADQANALRLVRALVRHLPQLSADEIATALATTNTLGRYRLCKIAGLRKASDEAWAMVLGVFRGEPIARVVRDEVTLAEAVTS